MALTTAAINEILDDIVTNFEKVALLTTSSTTGMDTAVNTGNIVNNPNYIDLVWASAASGSIGTSNTATNGTALNFSCMGGKTAISLALLNATGVVRGTIELPANVGFTGEGGGYFISEIVITMTELTEV